MSISQTEAAKPSIAYLTQNRPGRLVYQLPGSVCPFFDSNVDFAAPITAWHSDC